ncbi:MAG: energy-coupling factor ABC transporter ATP-binding protein [Archaeoglobus sp.]|jgi:cobalt transport protein ATP-binding subunit|nr:MAG: energy-coupling factor ABC transporter ATP-binding protein [Archaeoglobus sp.]
MVVDNMIDVRNVYFSYPDGVNALKSVTFTVKKGEKCAILGENGSGKTTLLMCMAGLLHYKGRIVVDGLEVNKKNERLIRRKVGIVFQNPDDQVFLPRVYDDVAFALRNFGMNEDEIRKRVLWSLNALDIVEIKDRSPSSLSLGQKKRVAIAGVLAVNPDVLLIDEPTAGLDHRGILEIYNVLEELNEAGKTVIITTHDVEFAESWADRVIVLTHGKVAKVGGREILDELEKFGMRRPIKRVVFNELGVKVEGAKIEPVDELSNRKTEVFGYGVDGVIPEIDMDIILLRGLNNPVKIKVARKLRNRFMETVKHKKAKIVNNNLLSDSCFNLPQSDRPE